MGLHLKRSDLDKLCRTAGIANNLLKKLIALLKRLLDLLERLDMEDIPAYQEYQEVISTLEQLQHTNESMVSQAKSYQDSMETAARSPELRASYIMSPEEEEAPETDAWDEGPLDSQSTGAFDRASEVKEAWEADAWGEGSPDLQDAEDSNQTPAPEAPKPAPRDVRILFSQSASVESAAEDTVSFSLPRFRRIPGLARIKPSFSRPNPRRADVGPVPNVSRSRPSFHRLPDLTEGDSYIEVPPGKLGAGEAPAPSSRPSAGTSSASSPVPPAVPPMNRVQFSAVVPRTLLRKEYSVLHLFMYEKEFHLAVEEVLQENPGLLKEHRSGILQVQQGASVRVELSTHNLKLTDNDQTQTWLGEYLRFDFPVYVPENFASRQIMFTARVYINDLIATRLYFVINCAAPSLQIVTPRRRDILSAFMSYAREDRARAAAILLGMQKARPDLNVFFDVESLRSGENWREVLPLEIARRDLFFLCWSHFAKDSVWVNREWNCALKVKGLACIEPIPLEPPDICPPPQELDGKQFNDRLLYLMHNPAGDS